VEADHTQEKPAILNALALQIGGFVLGSVLQERCKAPESNLTFHHGAYANDSSRIGLPRELPDTFSNCLILHHNASRDGIRFSVKTK
jgi:hypothetical protein